jgi:hypothetical protein
LRFGALITIETPRGIRVLILFLVNYRPIISFEADVKAVDDSQFEGEI